jgi:hypothetical protein
MSIEEDSKTFKLEAQLVNEIKTLVYSYNGTMSISAALGCVWMVIWSLSRELEA